MMNTPTVNSPTIVHANYTCDLVVGSTSIQFIADFSDAMDIGTEVALSGYQEAADSYNVTLYLPHDTQPGSHTIGASTGGFRASCSGEIGGNPFAFDAESGTLIVNSIDLAQQQIDATFEFKSGNTTSAQEAKNGIIKFTGAKI